MNQFEKRGRQSFKKLLLSAFLYCVAGNLFCTVMTISAAPFLKNEFLKVIIVILAIVIFYSLVFTCAYKDGDREQGYVRHHKDAEPADEKKWIKISAIITPLMLIPSLLLFLDKVSGIYYDVLMVFRVIDGMVYPLSLLLIPENTIDSMQEFVPFIFMLCYAFIPVVAHLGYYFGYTGKLNKENIIYKK